jgi:hypothetical protein
MSTTDKPGTSTPQQHPVRSRAQLIADLMHLQEQRAMYRRQRARVHEDWSISDSSQQAVWLDGCIRRCTELIDVGLAAWERTP